MDTETIENERFRDMAKANESENKEAPASAVEGIVKLPMPEGVERLESGAVQFGDDWPGIFLRGDDAMALALYISTAVSALEDDGNLIAAETLRSYEELLRTSKAT